MDEEQEQSVERDASDVAQNKPQKRVRLLSPRKQLQRTLQRMEKLAQSSTLKENKLADILLAMADIEKMLLKMSLDEEREKLEAENEALKAKVEEITAQLAKPRPDEPAQKAVSDFLTQLNAHVPSLRATSAPTPVASTLSAPTPVATPVTPVETQVVPAPVPTTAADSIARPPAPKPKPSLEAVREAEIEREKAENADRQSVMALQWNQAIRAQGF